MAYSDFTLERVERDLRVTPREADLFPEARPIVSALEASGLAVAAMLRRAVAEGGRVEGFKPHATAFLGDLIAHESHHRGQVGWALKLSGHPLDK